MIRAVAVPGRVRAGGGRREYIPVGLATASLLSTPPPTLTRPSFYRPRRDWRLLEDLAGDRLVAMDHDGGDDGIKEHALLVIQPASGIPGDTQIDLIVIQAKMVGDLRCQAEAGTGPALRIRNISVSLAVSLMSLLQWV